MKLIWLISALVFVVLISGCTGQEKPQQPETPTTEGAVAVEIKDFAYNPATINVSKGTTVAWTQLDSAGHTVTSVPGNSEAPKVLDSPLLSKGQSYSHTFNETGTFEYFCTVHPSMKGKVIVN